MGWPTSFSNLGPDDSGNGWLDGWPRDLSIYASHNSPYTTDLLLKLSIDNTLTEEDATTVVCCCF